MTLVEWHDRRVRRVAPSVVISLVLLAVAIAIEPMFTTLSWILAAIAGLIGLAFAMSAIGDPGASSWPEPGDAHDRKRRALRRMSPERNWHRKAPDAPDEPVEQIWARERARRRT